MNAIIKNDSTGLYSITVEGQTFESDIENCFNTSLPLVEKIFCSKLPYKIDFVVHIPGSNIELTIVQIDISTTKISFAEESYPESWDKKISGPYYFELKEQLLLATTSLNPVINLHEGNYGAVYFGFTIQLHGTTIGEVVQSALKINKSIDDRLNHAIERAASCMQLVLRGGLQIKLPAA